MYNFRKNKSLISAKNLDELSAEEILDHKYNFFRRRNKKEDDPIEQKREDDTEKRKGKFRSYIEKIRENLQKTGQNIAFAPLIPFKNVLSEMLIKKGGYKKSDVSKMKFSDLVTAFYDKFVKAKDNFDDYGEISTVMNFSGERGSYNIAPAVIIAIINAVVAFLTAMQEKKEAGEPMTDTEKKIADLADEVESGIEGAAYDELDRRAGKAVRETVGSIDINLIIILLLSAFVAFKLMGNNSSS